MRTRPNLKMTLGLLVCSGLMACSDGPERRAAPAAHVVDPVEMFRLDTLPAATEDAHTHRLRAGASPLSLSHPDPLDLPDTTIVFAGSDTLSSVTEEIISDFHDDGFRGNMPLNQSATGAGVRALCRREDVTIVNASRPVLPSEAALCAENGVQPVMIQVGHDPFVFIAHAENDWITDIRQSELRRLFAATRWSDIRPGAPDRAIDWYLPANDTGALAAMSEFVYGARTAPQISDIETAKRYPYVLEQTRDLSRAPDGLGFASLGKLARISRVKYNVLPIDGMRPIESGGEYPIKRPLYLITSREHLARRDVQTFLAYFLNETEIILPLHGFSPLGGEEAIRARRDLVEAIQSVTPAGTDAAVRLAQTP